MPILLDETTRAEYFAQSVASTRAALVVSALTGTVVVEIYDGFNVLRASGTMASPWATVSGATITVGEVNATGITVASGGAPTADWYCQFRSGSRYVRGQFGLTGSGRDFTWSLASFDTGSRGTIGTVTFAATGLADVPVNTVLPSVTGQPVVGQTLTANVGTWLNSPSSYAYQWQRSANGTTGWTSTGGVASTYAVTSTDLSQFLRVQVTATNASGSTAASSTATAAVSNPSSASTFFDSLYAPTFTLDSGTNAVTLPTQAKPAKSTNILTGGYTDQRFGTAIRRVTAVADAVGGAATHQRHEYSRRQAFNADSTLFLAQSSQGWWFLYDANTCQVIPSGITSGPGQNGILGLAGDCEPIWHPTDPLKIWHSGTNGGLVWQERTISRTGGTPTATTLFDLTSKLAALGAPWTSGVVAWFNGEGRPSNDGRWWGMAVEGTGFTSIGAIMYDRLTDTITAAIPTQGNRPNWIGTSPLGNWVVLSWYGAAAASIAAEAARPITQAAGVWAYSRDGSTRKVLSVLGEHSDMAVDAQGRECYVWISYRGFAEGGSDGILCRQIADDVVYNLPGPAYSSGGGNSFHISGCASDRPGWVVLGRYIEIGNGPYDGQVYVLELKQTGARAYRLAHTRSSIYNYFAEPHPTSNRDLTRVLFASDFGAGTTPFENYCICLPSWAIPS